MSNRRRPAVTITAPCHDCGTDTLPTDYGPRAEWYMVHNDIWDQAGMQPLGGYLCIGCLELRIGRRLNANDFRPCDLSDLDIADNPRWAWSLRTPRLSDRLGIIPHLITQQVHKLGLDAHQQIRTTPKETT